MCTPFATFPVTVEVGVGVGDGVGDEELLELLDVGLGSDGVGSSDGDVGDGEGDVAELDASVADGVAPAPATASELCDDPSRPNATTAPAVPPAISTQPAVNAATAARRRPAPGIPTPGTLTHP
ncbi:hypothetical protein GCM10009839_60200 [Catenulispora yoronensis]|uniref:Uncharacterized protein n=1 Tax=Catenulispora yoronensis TaxID=450799 RepID=A0ABP5GIH5_9ACTN